MAVDAARARELALTLPLDNHSRRVLQKQADGRWLIVSEHYMDVRQ
jgi:hypothetical protein